MKAVTDSAGPPNITQKLYWQQLGEFTVIKAMGRMQDMSACKHSVYCVGKCASHSASQGTCHQPIPQAATPIQGREGHLILVGLGWRAEMHASQGRKSRAACNNPSPAHANTDPKPCTCLCNINRAAYHSWSHSLLRPSSPCSYCSYCVLLPAAQQEGQDSVRPCDRARPRAPNHINGDGCRELKWVYQVVGVCWELCGQPCQGFQAMPHSRHV